jgi:hypothetical protein
MQHAQNKTSKIRSELKTRQRLAYHAQPACIKRKCDVRASSGTRANPQCFVVGSDKEALSLT